MPKLTEPLNPALQQAFLECHAEGHQWRHQGLVTSETEGYRGPFGWTGCVARRSVCASCEGERLRWYTRSGEVVNRYRHQDGYLHKKADPDDVAPSALEYRQRMVVTLFDQVTATASRKRSKASVA